MLISIKDRGHRNSLGDGNDRRGWRRLLSRNGRRTECERCGNRLGSDLWPSCDWLGRRLGR
jgi:hypothetical protein